MQVSMRMYIVVFLFLSGKWEMIFSKNYLFYVNFFRVLILLSYYCLRGKKDVPLLPQLTFCFFYNEKIAILDIQLSETDLQSWKWGSNLSTCIIDVNVVFLQLFLPFGLVTAQKTRKKLSIICFSSSHCWMLQSHSCGNLLQSSGQQIP